MQASAKTPCPKTRPKHLVLCAMVLASTLLASTSDATQYFGGKVTFGEVPPQREGLYPHEGGQHVDLVPLTTQFRFLDPFFQYRCIKGTNGKHARMISAQVTNRAGDERMFFWSEGDAAKATVRVRVDTGDVQEGDIALLWNEDVMEEMAAGEMIFFRIEDGQGYSLEGRVPTSGQLRQGFQNLDCDPLSSGWWPW